MDSGLPKKYCKDCEINTNQNLKNDYMIKNNLWKKYGVEEGKLCIDCIEKRLGRQLTAKDLTDCILNKEINPYTKALLSGDYYREEFKKEVKTKKIKFETLEEYLTEKNLKIFLNKLFEGEEIIHNKKIKELGFRPDYYIPGRKLVIEFDGFFHFTDNKVIDKDFRKENTMLAENVKFIRIPYFVQLSKDNIKILFGDIIDGEFEIQNNFNNYVDGFIDPKVVMPGRFSSLGLRKFWEFKKELVQEYGNIGMNLVMNIDFSLIDKLILENHTFFECFPETNFKEVKYNYQLLVDCYEDDQELLDYFKGYIEIYLGINLEEEIC